MSVKKLQEQDDVVSDVKEIITLIEGREWAEHCTKSPIGKKLEFLITEMHDEMAELQQKLEAMANVVIPEGYVLVPQSMNISSDAMESICFHGGDGGGQFGEFTDVILWVGDIENDDGTKTYGLNITTAEYPEEGSANISEFVDPIGSGTHDTADKAGAK